MNYKFIIYIISLCNLFGGINWVNYGWELFSYVSEARTAALGQATIAYNFDYPSSSLSNPFFSSNSTKHISLTHQSRFAGLVNSDLIGLQLKKEKRLININLILEGIGNIPNTTSALLDWGYDGQYDTNDNGESNGLIDSGERLDHNKITYFNQRRIGFHGSSIMKVKNIPIGIGIKILSHSLGNQNAIGVGLDFGFSKSIRNLNIGLVCKNIPASGMLWSNGSIEGTAPSLAIGFHQAFTFFDKNILTVNPVSSILFSMSESHLNSLYYNEKYSIDILYGIEAIYKEKIMLRLGQNSIYELTGGIGIDWNDFIIDYAFLPSTINGIFANHHLISLSVSVDWLFSRFKKYKN